jgi:amidase
MNEEEDMMVDEQLATLDAIGHAELVRTGQATPSELLEAAIARIEAADRAINAVSLPAFDEGLAAATDPALPDGPFRGVPFLTKDLWGANLVGRPVSMGNRVFKERRFRAANTDRLAEAYQRAGLVDIGKAASSEFGLLPATQSLACGPTVNPWDHTRTPGGSSGGSAAVVASGMVPIAHASDGGGSIRIPAAFCGVVGLKPSRGRISLGPQWVDRTRASHVVTRSVRDSALALDVTSRPEPGDLYFPGERPASYLAELDRDPKGLRVGVLTSAPTPVDTECVAAAQHVASLLEDIGHRIEPATLDGFFDRGGNASSSIGTRVAFSGSYLRPLERLLGRPVEPEDVEPYTWAVLQPDQLITAQEHVEALEAQQAYTSRVSRWWEDHDILLSPTTGRLTPTIQQMEPPVDDPFAHTSFIGEIAVFTYAFNLTGQPSVSVPVHWTEHGLPVGVQLTAAMGREDLLLQVARQLEVAAPWAHRYATLLGQAFAR